MDKGIDRTGIDVAKNRGDQKWRTKELLGRFLWSAVRPLFEWSPRPFWGWRNLLLRLFGASIADRVHIYPSVRITIPWNLSIGSYSAIGDRAIVYALGPIRLGKRVTVSQGAHLCAGTHDYLQPSMPLLKQPIDIEDDAWVCADAFIGPNVVVGARAIVGARAVAMKNVPKDMVVVGNPARPVRSRAGGAE